MLKLCLLPLSLCLLAGPPKYVPLVGAPSQLPAPYVDLPDLLAAADAAIVVEEVSVSVLEGHATNRYKVGEPGGA